MRGGHRPLKGDVWTVAAAQSAQGGAGGAGWRASTRLQYPGYDHTRGCARVQHGAPVRNRRAGSSSPVDANRKLRDIAALGAPAHFARQECTIGDTSIGVA